MHLSLPNLFRFQLFMIRTNCAMCIIDVAAVALCAKKTHQDGSFQADLLPLPEAV